MGQQNNADIVAPIGLKEWAKDFQKLLQEDRKEFMTSEPPIEVTVEEVQETCKRLKNKAPEPGGIPAELVK